MTKHLFVVFILLFIACEGNVTEFSDHKLAVHLTIPSHDDGEGDIGGGTGTGGSGDDGGTLVGGSGATDIEISTDTDGSPPPNSNTHNATYITNKTTSSIKIKHSSSIFGIVHHNLKPGLTLRLIGKSPEFSNMGAFHAVFLKEETIVSEPKNPVDIFNGDPRNGVRTYNNVYYEIRK